MTPCTGKIKKQSLTMFVVIVFGRIKEFLRREWNKQKLKHRKRIHVCVCTYIDMYSFAMFHLLFVKEMVVSIPVKPCHKSTRRKS